MYRPFVSPARFGSLRTWISDAFRPHLRQSDNQRHIILDLDESLVHSFEGTASLGALGLFGSPRHVALRRRIYVLKDDIWGITRPHLDSFVEACFSHFATVTVWSAGEESYVHEVVKRVFRNLPKPDLVMTRNDCVDIATGDYPLYAKPLRIAREYQDALLRRDAVMTEANTLILEDRYSAVLPEDRLNALFVPPYEPEARLPAFLRDDPALETLAGWFKTAVFRDTPDVRQIPRPVFYCPATARGVVRAEHISRPIFLANLAHAPASGAGRAVAVQE
jgi:hypothetical protein